jgi:drug/metabolite transporter (DMT)-like permease
MVPIVQATMDRDFRSVPKTTWIGCLVALAGVVVMGLDASALSALSLDSLHVVFTRGDALIVAAALLYTLHVVKLGYWAKQTTPLKLSTAKSIVQTALSLCFVAALSFAAVSAQGAGSLPPGLAASALGKGKEIVQFFASVATQWSTGQMAVPSWGKVVGTILWCGTVGNAYVLYAQSYGQRLVRPSDANLVYSLQPIFTAFFAYLFLGETMGATGLAGGALILLAVSLVATETLSGRSSQQDPEVPSP